MRKLGRLSPGYMVVIKTRTVASLLVRNSTRWFSKFEQTMSHGLQEVATGKSSANHHIASECGWGSSFSTLFSPPGPRLFMVSCSMTTTNTSKDGLEANSPSLHRLFVPESWCHRRDPFGFGRILRDGSYSVEFLRLSTSRQSWPEATV